MSTLHNTKHEHFAHLVAQGESPAKAYVLCGYSEKGAFQSGNRLLRTPTVFARVEELKRAVSERQTEKVALDRSWVRAKLMEIVNRAMQVEPVRDNAGRLRGEYTYQGSVAIKALELLGKDLGMFQSKEEAISSSSIILRLNEGRQRVAEMERMDDQMEESKRMEESRSIESDLSMVSLPSPAKSTAN